VDTLRWDRLGCYGYDSAETPHIDALAEKGTLFERVIAPSPITLPSHATMLTGLTPATHAVHDNAACRLPDKHESLATRLKREGYVTAGVIGGFPLASQFGMSQGFDAFFETGLRSHAVRRSPEPDRQILVRGTPPDRPADQVTRDALRWASTVKQDQPFFLFVHYYDPHVPYEPPEPFLSRHDSPYDGEIAFTDSEIGRLFQGLADRGLMDHTLIVFTADHGEALGEHGEETHGYLLHDATLRVPLILQGPNIPKGKRISSLVALSDIVPTLLDHLSIRHSDLDGHSLVPLFRDRPFSQPRQIYSECLLPHFSRKCYPIRSLTTEDWRYIDAGEDELFHLAIDPGENHNVARDHPEKIALLKPALESYPLIQDPDARGQLSPEDAAVLRDLGYLGAGQAVPDRILREGRNPREILPFLTTFYQAVGFMRQSRFEEAMSLLQDLMTRLPGDIEVLDQAASCAFALGNLEEASQWAKEALALDPINPGPRRILARCHGLRNDWQGALQVYEEGARASGETQPFAFHFDIADCYFRLGQTQKALTIAEQAAGQPGALMPKVEYAALLIEASQQRQGFDGKTSTEELMERAFDSLREALAIQPHHVLALYHMGLYFLSEDRPSWALAFFKKALRVDPVHAESLNNAALCYLQISRPLEAIQHYDFLIESVPGSLFSRIGRACALFSIPDRAEDSVAELEQLLEEYPDHPKVLYNLSFCYEQLGRNEEALRGYRRLVQLLHPSDRLRLEAHAAIDALTLTAELPE